MDRVAIFVDVQNVFYTVRQVHGCNFDYTEFWNQVTADRHVVKAFAYAIDRQDPKQMRFQQILESIGFEVKLKPYIQRSDGSAKGDWDVGITLDMIEWANEIDVAVLASGDGDFDLFFTFPWPGEHEFFETIFDRFAADGAMLLTYQGIERLRLQRRVV